MSRHWRNRLLWIFNFCSILVLSLINTALAFGYWALNTSEVKQTDIYIYIYIYIYTGCSENTVKTIMLFKNNTKKFFCKCINHNVCWTITDRKKCHLFKMVALRIYNCFKSPRKFINRGTENFLYTVCIVATDVLCSFASCLMNLLVL